MSLRDAWNDGLEWAGETLDDVKEYATEKVIDYKVDKYVKSFTDELATKGKSIKNTNEIKKLLYVFL